MFLDLITVMAFGEENKLGSCLLSSPECVHPPATGSTAGRLKNGLHVRTLNTESVGGLRGPQIRILSDFMDYPKYSSAKLAVKC
jgi:hypothetical protein